MLLSGTYVINVSTSPFMVDPSPQTILRHLHALGFDPNHLRMNAGSYHASHTQDAAFITLGHQLRGAYFSWFQDSNLVATLTHLENARAMCNRVLSPAYLSIYNIVVSYFEARTSRAGTPVHVEDQNARMQNLLLRVTTCLH